MVAHQSFLEPMIDQPGVAMRALQAEAAGAAQRERRIAAAVEEQQRLLAAFERALHRFGQTRRNEPPARRTLAPQVDRLDRRHKLAAETLGQRNALIAAAPRVDFRSTDGVAEASTTGIFATRPRTTAMSRAW